MDHYQYHYQIDKHHIFLYMHHMLLCILSDPPVHSLPVPCNKFLAVSLKISNSFPNTDLFYLLGARLAHLPQHLPLLPPHWLNPSPDIVTARAQTRLVASQWEELVLELQVVGLGMIWQEKVGKREERKRRRKRKERKGRRERERVV